MSNTTLPRVGDGALRDLTRRIEDAIRALEKAPLAGAVIIGPVTFASTADVRVYHGLGRAPVGFWQVRKNFAVDVTDGLVPEAIDPANYITLRASLGGVSITLAVF